MARFTGTCSNCETEYTVTSKSEEPVQCCPFCSEPVESLDTYEEAEIFSDDEDESDEYDEDYE